MTDLLLCAKGRGWLRDYVKTELVGNVETGRDLSPAWRGLSPPTICYTGRRKVRVALSKRCFSLESSLATYPANWSLDLPLASLKLQTRRLLRRTLPPSSNTSLVEDRLNDEVREILQPVLRLHAPGRRQLPGDVPKRQEHHDRGTQGHSRLGPRYPRSDEAVARQGHRHVAQNRRRPAQNAANCA